MILVKKLGLFLLLFSFISLQRYKAQSTSSSYNNWATYFLNFKLNSKWGIHFDAQFRGDEEFRNIKQHLVRSGIQYSINSNIHLTLGYAHVNSYSSTLKKNISEFRPWQQLILQQNLNRTQNTLRFRLEQRFIENYSLVNNTLNRDKNKFGNRFRVFDRWVVEIIKKESSSFYLALQDEIFFNIPDNPINKNAVDQNRFLVAFGLFKNGNTRFELGYMNQYLFPSNSNYSMNNILHLSILQNFPTKNTQQVPSSVEK